VFRFLGARQPVILAICCLDFIVSYAGCSLATLGTSGRSDSSCNCRQLNWDSSVFVFSMQESSTELGTPLVVRFLLHLRFIPIKLVCYQVASRYSDQGADLGKHIEALISTFQAYFL
jgi:hypothetical protein